MPILVKAVYSGLVYDVELDEEGKGRLMFESESDANLQLYGPYQGEDRLLGVLICSWSGEYFDEEARAGKPLQVDSEWANLCGFHVIWRVTPISTLKSSEDGQRNVWLYRHTLMLTKLGNGDSQ